MRIGLSLKLSEPKYNVLAQNIRALFADGSQGWWYDDDDLTTLFQDSAGTTPVTAVEQFVGLQLDKSKGLVLGPDIIVNGDYSAGTANWTAFGTNLPTLSAANNQLTVSLAGPSGSAGAYQAITTVIGKWYIVRAPQINLTGVSPRLRVGTTIDGSENANVIVSNNSNSGAIFLATSTTTYISLRATLNTAGVNVIWGPVSTRELPGNHRYAPASGNRPIWSKRVNLLTKTEQFDDAAWTKGRSAIAAANTIVAPDGTLTAEKLVDDTQSGTHRAFQTVLGAAIADYSFSVYVKAAERTNVGVAITSHNETTRHRVLFDLLGNGSGQTTTGSGTFAIQNVGDGWYKCSITGAIISGDAGVAGFIYVLDASGNFNYTGTGTNGIYIWGADLRPANQATGTMPLYQRVNTSSDYDTNGFPGYLKADGVDDFLQTNSIDFTATDKITLCAGVRKLSDAARGMLTELSANAETNSGAFFITAPNSAAGNYAFLENGGGNLRYTVPVTYNAPITNVLSCGFSLSATILADAVTSRINGVLDQDGLFGTQTTGNFGNYPAYFFRRAGTSNPFTGNEYGNIAVGKLLTAGQLSALETYMNGLTKAY